MKPKREAECGTREWDVCVRVEERSVSGDGGSGRGKGRSKGLMKTVLWVRSVGKGSKVGDVKGLVLGGGEADKSAEKTNGQTFSAGPMGREGWFFI